MNWFGFLSTWLCFVYEIICIYLFFIFLLICYCEKYFLIVQLLIKNSKKR